MRKKEDLSHSYRIKEKKWREIEAKAWKMSQDAGRIIKPTDIVDAILFRGIKEVTQEDIERSKMANEIERKNN